MRGLKIMTNASRFTPTMLTAALLLLGVLKCGTGAEATPSKAASPIGVPAASQGSPAVAATLYARQASLQETLRATRGKYRAWLAEQPAARKSLEFGPWLATPPLPAADAARVFGPAGAIDPNAKLADGRLLWSPQTELVDGKPVKFLTASGPTSVFVARTIRASQPVALTVGLGGGDRLDVWLNGRQIASASTHLISGRYGCGFQFDGTRVDQMLVSLDLQASENSLVIQLAPSDEPSFYFSASPNPVPRLWEQIRRDFPAAQNPLLDLVHADWFGVQGWLADPGTAFEEQLIGRLIADGRDTWDRLSSLSGGSHGQTGKPAPRWLTFLETWLPAQLDELKQAGAGRDDRRWLDLCVKASVLAALSRDLARLRAAVSELGRSPPNTYPAAELLARLDDYEQRLLAQAGTRLDSADEATRRLMAEMPAMQRQMLVDLNPLLRDADIVFVKRYTYNSKHYYDDFQHISRWGGNLCVLSLADGQVREIVPELAGGVFDRYDLSFDARRIVFGYRRPQREGFRLYEVGVDGGGLRRVTVPPADEEERIVKYGKTSTGDSFYGLLGYQFWTDDVHPCCLPDGGLCFASTRCEHGVLCTPNHYLACTTLFRMDANGSNLRPISQGALSEFTPTMMADGRILYNRWEYVYKGIAAVQSLWVTRPDGSGSEEFYGDNITNPGVLWQARQVPGHPRLAVCIGCGHEPMGIGQVLLLDLTKDKRTPQPMISLTPNVKTENLRGLYQLRNGVWREDVYGPFYADPYPLSDTFFLVSCNPNKRYNDQTAYDIHLLDAFGNRVPVYHDPAISCWQPMVLRPRTTPPVVAGAARPTSRPCHRENARPTSGPCHADRPCHTGEVPTATVFLQDVYRGLPGVAPGTVKYVRVMEQIPKPWAAEVDPLRDEDRSADGFGGHLAVSWNTHIWVAVLWGIVPVEEDGSACFEVPAERNLFFQALDEDFMEVQRMRTFVNFAPGEQRSCIGCHEHRTQAPASTLPVAFGRPPATLSAQPGETAPRPLYYPTDVQPILDRHCVRCHDGTSAPSSSPPKAAPDLRGELTTLFNRSYESILQGGLVATIREWAGGNYAMQNAEAVPPYSHGSHRSRLVEVLKASHYDLQLSREEWIKLATWIDCGAPYYGSYYGRRNLMYQGAPDFRPVPTLSSACGIPPVFPEPPKPEPLPAELLAWWPLDDTTPDTADDASGHAHQASAVHALRTEGRDGRGGRRFDGKAYVEAGGLGKHKAISIALWAKAETLGSAWSPLLFCNDAQAGVVHFSLVPDGTPNVAVNTGGSQWTHRRARTSVADGGWHHLALVCDGRVGGSVRFYVDGQLSGQQRAGLALQLDLTRFRLGAYNRWENAPANNFHGELDDVRVYRGMLSDGEVTQLSNPANVGRLASP